MSKCFVVVMKARETLKRHNTQCEVNSSRAMSTDALALAQLELLYRLGVIEREPLPCDITSANQTLRHDSLAAAGDRVVDSSQEDLRMPIRTEPRGAKRLQQESLVTAGVLHHVMRVPQDAPHIHESATRHASPRHSRSQQRQRAAQALSKEKAAASTTYKREYARTWFLRWTLHLRNAREKRNVHAIWVFRVKKRVWTALWRFVQRQQRLALQTTVLQTQWKARRAVRQWCEWATRHKHIQRLLARSHVSLVSCLRKRRVWQRWVRFAAQSRHYRALLTAQTHVRTVAKLRTAWQALKAATCRHRQSRRALGKFLCALRANADAGVRKHQRMHSVQAALRRHTARRVLRHWRVAARRQSTTRARTQFIALQISRKRYFRIWQRCRDASEWIAPLRAACAARAMREHFAAWSNASRALRLARTRASETARDTRIQYFHSWRCETLRRLRCHRAALVIECLQQKRALQRLQQHVCERQRHRRLLDAWRVRCTRRIWRHGFLVFHAMEQQIKADAAHQAFALKHSVFLAWTHWRQGRVERRAALAHARTYALQRQMLIYWRYWQSLWRARIERKQHIARSARHYRLRLLQRGVNKVVHHVAQRSAASEQSCELRRRMRVRIRAACFRAWKAQMERARRQRHQIMRFQSRGAYKRTWFCPLRRVWDVWRAFTRAAVQLQRIDRMHQRTLARRMLRAWHEYTQRCVRVAVYRLQRSSTTLQAVVDGWRTCMRRWQRRREQLALACAADRRTRCTRAMRAWCEWTRRVVRVQQHHRELTQRVARKTLATCIRLWSTLAEQHTRAKALARTLRQRSTLSCLLAWRRHAALRRTLKLKLCYFRLVFGTHASTSCVQQTWQRWRHVVRIHRGARALCARRQRVAKRLMWQHWMLFHVYKRVVRDWHRLAAQEALTSGHFGKRLRLFHGAARRLQTTRALRAWRLFYHEQAQKRDALKRARQRTLVSVVIRHRQLVQARVKYMKTWLARWHAGVHARSNAATRYFHAKVLRKHLSVWWRFTAHAMQARLVAEAKNVLGPLPTYHPQQQRYTQIVQAKALALRAAATANKRDAALKQKRRMLDPEEARRYASATPVYNAPRERERRALPRDSLRREPTKPAAVAGADARKKAVRRVHDEQNENDARNAASTQQQISPHATRRPRASASVRPAQSTGVPIAIDDMRVATESKRPDTSQARGTSRRSPAPREFPVQHTGVQELPLFDAPSPLQRESETSRCTSLCNAHEDAKPAQQQVLKSPDHRATKSTRRRDRSFDHQELPLWDSDFDEQHPVGQSSSVLTSKAAEQQAQAPVWHRERRHDHGQKAVANAPQASRAVDLQHRTPDTTTQFADSSEAISLEQLASMELLAPDKSVAWAQASALQQHTHVTPKSVSTASHKVIAERRSRPQRALPLSPGSSTSAISLTTILEAPASQHKQQKKLREHASANTVDPSATTEASPTTTVDTVREICEYYSQHLVDAAHSSHANAQQSADEDPKTRRKRACFCMLRDLGLFQNEFYFPQLETALETLDTERIDFAHAQISGVLDADDRAYLAQLESDFVKTFLDRVIGLHPLYKTHTSTSRGHRASSGPSQRWFSTSALDDGSPTMQWLVRVHLAPWRQVKSSRSSKRQPFWLASTLPSDIVAALDKLLLCITKYFRVLAQLFSLRASDAQQLSKGEFTHLLKHVHVFPQLLMRREIEVAFDASCCARPDQKAISFPEFVEALLRCSASLPWSESRAPGDADVVVRFLMLLFAMEGRGSVLQRRSEDLQVVISVLEQQHVRTKAEKLQRFRKLLTEHRHQEHSRGAQATARGHCVSSSRTGSNKTRPGARASRKARAGPCHRESSNVFFCDATGSNAHGDQALGHVRDGLWWLDDAVLGHDTQHPQLLSTSNELVSPVSSMGERPRAFTEQESSGAVEQHECPPQRSEGAVTVRACAAIERGAADDASTSCPVNTNSVESSSNSMSSSVHDHEEATTPTSAAMMPSAAHDTSATAIASSYRLGELRDKDDFMREILSSIGDVELVLQQSNRQLPPLRRPSLGAYVRVLGWARACDTHEQSTRTLTMDRSLGAYSLLLLTHTCADARHSRARSVDEYSDDFEADESESARASDVVRSLFASSSAGLQHVMSSALDDGDATHVTLDQVDDVHVSDPMLNQLTHIERFTESAGAPLHLRSCLGRSCLGLMRSVVDRDRLASAPDARRHRCTWSLRELSDVALPLCASARE